MNSNHTFKNSQTQMFCLHIKYIAMKILQLVCRRWRWQVFRLDPFTYAYCPGNAKRIPYVRSDNILFRDVILKGTGKTMTQRFLNKPKV